MEDRQIVQLFLERNEWALKETDLKYGTALQRLSMRIVNNREDAEECRNDTYWKTWDTIPPQKPQVLYPYVMGICRFLSCNRISWKRAGKRNAAVIELTEELERCIPDAKAEVSMRDREIGEVIGRFLKEQSEENKVIFMRRYWYAERIRAIAEELQVSEGKVKMSLSRSRKKLKEYLEKEGIVG